MGHHQYWKALPVDTTPLLGEHEESGLKLGLWGGHTLSLAQKRRCHSSPQAAGGY